MTLEILIICLQKSFTELKNLDPWLRYDWSNPAPECCFHSMHQKRAQKSTYSHFSENVCLAANFDASLLSHGLRFLNSVKRFCKRVTRISGNTKDIMF